MYISPFFISIIKVIVKEINFENTFKQVYLKVGHTDGQKKKKINFLFMYSNSNIYRLLEPLKKKKIK